MAKESIYKREELNHASFTELNMMNKITAKFKSKNESQEHDTH